MMATEDSAGVKFLGFQFRQLESGENDRVPSLALTYHRTAPLITPWYVFFVIGGTTFSIHARW